MNFIESTPRSLLLSRVKPWTQSPVRLSIFLFSFSILSKYTSDIVVKPQDASGNAKASTSAPVSGVGVTKPSDKGKFVPKPGEPLSHSNLFPLLGPTAFAVALAKVLSNMELVKLERARKVVTDPTMEEIIQEHPQGHSEFENAVRFHIISFAQRINVSLSILDKLMELFNSRASATAD